MTGGSTTVSLYDYTKLSSVYLDMKRRDATAQGNRTVPIINGLKDANFPAATNAENAIIQKGNKEGTYVEKRLGTYFEEAETAKGASKEGLSRFRIPRAYLNAYFSVIGDVSIMCNSYGLNSNAGRDAFQTKITDKIGDIDRKALKAKLHRYQEAVKSAFSGKDEALLQLAMRYNPVSGTEYLIIDVSKTED
jgi:hypothetical protein